LKTGESNGRVASEFPVARREIERDVRRTALAQNSALELAMRLVVTRSQPQRGAAMGVAAYKVRPYQGGWGVTHDGSTVGPYESKESAFEAS
jgi:hypothetical protein